MKFEVSKNGMLHAAAFVEPRTNAEAYDIRKSWLSSTTALVGVLEDCVPLSWEVHRMYSEYRDLVEAELQGVREARPRRPKQIEAFKTEFGRLPEDPGAGAREWLLRMSPDDFKTTIVPQIQTWLADKPDWGAARAHLEHATAIGLAFLHFNDMDSSDLDLLQIDLEEGSHPGDDSRAAMLLLDIDEANRVAQAAGLSERFVRQEGVRDSR